MKPYSLTTKRVSYRLDGSGKWYTTLDTFSSRWLTVSADNINGNKRTPNRHDYSVNYKQNAAGSFASYNNVDYTWGVQTVVLTASTSWSFDPRTDLETLAYNQAVSNLYDKIRGNLDLSVDLAEASKTAAMVRGAWEQAASAGTAYLKKAITTVRNRRTYIDKYAMKEIGKLWLSYKYGWMPLFSSAYELTSRMIGDPTNNFRIFIKARSSVRDTRSGVASYGCDWAFQDRFTSRCELGVVLSPRTSRLASLAGFTSLNPVNLAWELMPYSFVIDWFYDIGGYLRAAESAMLYSDNFVSGYRTNTKQHVREFKQASSKVDHGGGYYSLYTGFTPPGGFQRVKTRTILSSMPFPARPVLKCDLGASRMMSAASLLSQFLEVKRK